MKICLTRVALALTFLLSFPSFALAAPPDLTGLGVIAALKSDSDYSSRPYTETYNLGATGLRGWIYIDGNNAGDYGLITAPSRQILVTVATAPANAVLEVDDVILGAMAASSGEVPLFASDCRKALGVAIGEAEKAGAGTLRVKRWRAGVTTDENIPMVILGDYTATSPHTCPKSAVILANARTKLIDELKADSNFLSAGYGGAINGLALLAGVAAGDADYDIVQARLKNFADSLVGHTLQPWGMETWSWSYMSIFLSEYYLRTVEDGVPDASVLAAIDRYTVTIAKGQSRYGTFGHGVTPPRPDGSLHGTVTPYGPLNAAGIPANIAIILGKKALVAGGQTIDPEIDPAIQRGSDFFSYYMNKGSIPYGEHEPWAGGHASNGKDSMCAVLFGLQDNRLAEAEYFARMSVAGCTGREYGHTGQGLSYLWGAMGANIGGPTAVAKYMENFRWHSDLVRRTDGSFSYDGQEQYGGGETADGSYLGKCGYNDINPTATYVLSFGVSLQRIYITGKNAIPANTLSAAKVDDAIAAATYKLDCPVFTTTQLLADLSAYDPVVRSSAATQLASRTLTSTEVENLIASITDGTMSSNPSTRMGACQALGARQATGALTALGQRLSDTDLWVRGKAAQALRSFPAAIASAQRDTMLVAFAANATDPEVIVWNDPVQIANNYLSFALFGDSIYGKGWNHIAPYTINAPKNLLYPAVKAGLKQPDSNPRLGVANFAKNYLTLADAQALTPDLFAAATTGALADTMWHGAARAAGIQAVARYKPAEAIPIALSMMEVEQGYGWGAFHSQIAALNVMSSFGDAARWTLPALRKYALTWETTSSQYVALTSAIASIDAAITSPAGMINLVAVPASQVLVTPVSTAKAITLAGTTPRGSVTFSDVTAPLHGTLTGTAPNLIYTPATGYTGPDHFTFKVADSLTTSEPGTVSLIVGTAGAGLKGEYFDNTNFTNLKLTRTDAQLDFDWGTGTPDASIGADTFSVRWSGQLLVPETGSYTFSTLNSDGARLFINGVPVINDYVDQTTSWKDGAPISLIAGQRVELQMEYYENTGSAVAKLKWRGPTMAGINGSIIAKEWLYDGTGVANRTPYAHTQTVSLIQNSPQVVTLTGSGVAQNPLVYSVVSQPSSGTLTGVAPNLTYTPAANFSGSDSFTFLVNNGTSNSAPATVFIGIWGGAPTLYYWTDAVDGDWSGASWSNAAGGAVTPSDVGDSSYSLNFDEPGIYTTTQDLSNNFEFNQLNLAGTVTLTGANSLSSVANGSLLPQINQNSVNPVSFKTPLNLVAMTSFSGVGGGSITMAGVISGTGGVNKDSPGTLEFYGLTPNPYSGGTNVSGGTLHLGTIVDGRSPHCINPVGTGPVTLNSGGTIQFDRVSANNALIANGGTLFTPNGWGAVWNGAINLNGTVTVNAPYGLTCTGNISGDGGFTKVDVGPLVLTGTNSFTGANRITRGTLSCSKAAALGAGHLDITLGAKVALNFTGTKVIAALTFNGGSPLAPGTYGSATSPATNQNSTYFTGNGTITILPSSSTVLSLSNGSTPSDLGSLLTFTATVTGTVPTGNVEFYDGATLLGTSALDGSFQASFTIGSLAVGSYSITAKYSGNTTHAASISNAQVIEITSQFPPPPMNLFAVRDVGSVGLTWTVSAGATSYQIKRALTDDGPYTTLGTSSVANYNDLTALDNVSYYYVVSANNASGESANSASFSLMPLVPSSAKDILTFVFPGLPAATISGTNIHLTVAAASAVTAISPTYTVSSWATGSPASGTSRNFSTPQTYTITASDHSTQIYTVTVTVAPPPLIYDFNDATLQGWNNRVWNGSAWIDLAANATTYAGTLLPASGNNGLFVPNNNAVWVSGSMDHHLNTLWLRSPQFYLNGTSDLTVQLAKGIAKTTAPADDLAVPFTAATGGGWKGVALRRVSDGVFVLNKPRNVGDDDNYRTVTFTQTELATLDFSAAYTLELINSDRGGWGWLTMDNVSIPGIVASTTNVVSSVNPAPLGATVTFTATVAGRMPTGNVAFYAGATLLGTNALNASFRASITASNMVVGSSTITATYAGNANNSASTSPAWSQEITGTPFEVWASNLAHGFTPGVNNAPEDDPDKDGIANLLEFALGSAPMASSQSNLPELSKVAGNWVFEYERSDLSLTPATVQVVEYGSNLTGWTSVVIPATSAGMVEITLGSPSDHVKVNLPAGGPSTFVRLKVSQ
jgi:autotransporter-associated beta strand protein